MTPQEFIDAFQMGQVPAMPPTGLCGRIIRGTVPTDFDSLTNDPSRKVVFIMDAEGLMDIFGKTGYEALLAIGYTADYIADLVRSHHTFELVVFPATSAHQATWDELAVVCSDAYPELCPDFVRAISKLADWPFSWYEAEMGYNFGGVGKEDPRFMSYENYLRSARDHRALRGFLYHTCYVTKLYSGDGYTYNEQGQRGLAEYVMQNKRIADIAGATVCDIEVQLP